MKRYKKLFEWIMPNIGDITFYHHSPISNITMLRPAIENGINYGISLTDKNYSIEDLGLCNDKPCWGTHQYEIKLHPNAKIVDFKHLKIADYNDPDLKNIYIEAGYKDRDIVDWFKLEEALVRLGYAGRINIEDGKIYEVRIFNPKWIKSIKQVR